MRDPKIAMYTVATAASLLGPAGMARDMSNACRDVAKLERISRSISRRDEMACVGVPDPTEDPRKGIVIRTEAHQADNDKAVARLMAKARKIADAYGFKLRHQGDCRGAALYILRADGSEWAI